MSRLQIQDTEHPIVLFKVKDYTTQILGRYDKVENVYYVQRGDGTIYKYEAYRVNDVIYISESRDLRSINDSISYKYSNELCKLKVVDNEPHIEIYSTDEVFKLGGAKLSKHTYGYNLFTMSVESSHSSWREGSEFLATVWESGYVALSLIVKFKK